MDQSVPPSSEFTVPVSHPSLSHSHSTHSLHSIASDLFASDGPPSTRSQSNVAAAVGWESYVAELGKDKVTLLSSNARPAVPISVKPKTKEPEEFTDNRIYVSNIPFSFREIDLANMFTPYGRVVNVEIVMKERGSKGFGFVTLDNREGCERARRELHGCHVQGRIIEKSELINFYPAFLSSMIYFRSKSTELPDVTWLQRVISREVERQAQEQQRRAYDHVVTQLMAGLVRTGQIQGELPGMQHGDLHSLQLPYTGLHRSHSTRLPADLPALSSGNQLPANIYGSMGIQMERMQPSNSSSTSSIFSNLQLPLSFAPSLTTPSVSGSESTCFDSNGLDSTLQPLPFSPSHFHSSSDVFLSSASQFGPIGTRPSSAKSSASTDEGIHMGSGDGNTTMENGKSSRAESTLSAAAEATISPVEKTEQGEETFVMQNVLDALPEINEQNGNGQEKGGNSH
ncbi:hypothetical protein WR25_24663 [Diploscapter pachys]|uniref:RRM domain-containing protein n=1 Tax=Diploscapter pachys TaxID=2018661 RepID=A0A2A2KFN8_9BILA|nr:hypothetical protein WR25_24663 [Diploscapter pachys]